MATSLSALASGQGDHHHTEEMSEHTQSMMAVKESVPEEYQIMERVPIFALRGIFAKGERTVFTELQRLPRRERGWTWPCGGGVESFTSQLPGDAA